MATVLNDLQTFLATEFPGETVRAGYAPTEPDRVVALIELPGEEPLPTFVGACGFRMERPVIQVRARTEANSYEDARELAESVFKALHNLVNVTLSGTHYSLIEALQSPHNLGIDEYSRWTCGFSVKCWKEPN